MDAHGQSGYQNRRIFLRFFCFICKLFHFCVKNRILTLENMRKSRYNGAVYVLSHDVTNRTMRGNDYMSGSSKKKLRKEENAAKLTERQQKELKTSKKLKIQTIAFVVAISLILVIGLGALGITAYQNSGIIERNTIALTVGDQSLTTADLSYFYIDNINATYQEWYQSYGENTSVYASLLHGLDVFKPLDQQNTKDDPSKTQADYYIDLAVEKAVSTYALYAQALDSNFKLSDDTVFAIDSTMDALHAGAKRSGYRGINEYLKAFYGNGADEESFRKYLEVTETAAAYETDAYNNFTYTDSDLEAYNKEHFSDFSSFSYDSIYLPVNSFVQCTADKDDKEHEHSKEELDEAEKAAKKAADFLVASKPKTAEALNKAIQRFDSFKDSTCTEYEDVLYSKVSNVKIAAWLAESNRKDGDIIAIANETETKDENGNSVTKLYGYTIAIYHGRNDNETNLVNVRHILNSFTGGTTDEFGNTIYPVSSVEASKKAIAELEQAWLSAGGTEEAFAKLAEEKTTDTGSMDNGGLYENVYPGQMVSAFNNWCFDEARKPGDYGTVETEYGMHLLYYVGQSDVTFRNYMIENTMRNEDYQKWYNEYIASAQYTVADTSKMDTSIIMATD